MRSAATFFVTIIVGILTIVMVITNIGNRYFIIVVILRMSAADKMK